MTTQQPTTTLWRPTGPKELDLVRALGWRAWPPRLPEQPIFYPVLNEDYAIRIARDWNVKHDGAGFVTRRSATGRAGCPTSIRHRRSSSGTACRTRPSRSTGSAWTANSCRWTAS
ncbi:hypothetical protein [Streptomyces sp. NBC_00986]|uniref:hypothetical protein n=1 Tax=Streptomyces sp. NBC_00986 TaxID=2903702 RepID=UPI003863D512|nr:hypothetical protein OG504_05910 [Streptomyces sp. NBC_00986]